MCDYFFLKPETLQKYTYTFLKGLQIKKENLSGLKTLKLSREPPAHSPTIFHSKDEGSCFRLPLMLHHYKATANKQMMILVVSYLKCYPLENHFSQRDCEGGITRS